MLVNPMAAGRKSVLGKRESYKYGSFDESDYYYKKGSSGMEGYVFHGGKEDREEGEIFVEHVDGDEALPPPEKRRKFSAIEFDLAEKEARISSKSKVAHITESLSRAGGVLSAYSPNSSCVDEESDLYGWNITKSRWACDGLSPVGGDDDKYKQQKGSPGSPSPEVGECSDGTITSLDVDEQVIDSLSGSFGNSGTMHMQRNLNMCQSCRSVSEFEMIKKINEGTYGVVYKAKDKKTGEIVALKKVKMNMEKEGFPLTALREMNILLSLNHPSIVDVKEVVVDDNDDKDGTYMVMEHMQYDLKGLMEVKKHPFSIAEIKSLMLQLLEGVNYLHENWVLHRDLKSSNILLNEEGQLKICDFGMSRQYGSPPKPYTSLVVTLWYR